MDVSLLSKLPQQVFRQTEAARAGINSRDLYRLRDAGAVEQISRGLYRRTDTPAVDLDLLEIALRSRTATICLTSALAHHGLVDAVPSRTDIAIPRGTRAPVTIAAVRWHRFDSASFDLGRAELPVEGAETTIGIYSAERSIVDAYRLRGIEGYEIATEALRNWLRRRDSNPSSLVVIAEGLPRASSPLRQALEFLA